MVNTFVPSVVKQCSSVLVGHCLQLGR